MSYKDDKRKEKLVNIAMASGLIAFVCIGGYFLYKHLFKPQANIQKLVDKDKKLVDFMITADKKGNINLLRVINGENVDKASLPNGEYKYSISNKYNQVIAIDSNTSKLFKIEEVDKKIKVSELATLNNLNFNDIKEMKNDNNYLYIMKNDNKSFISVTLDNGKSKEYGLDKEAEKWTVKDEMLIYSNNNDISVINVSNSKINGIDVGDKTTGFDISNNKLLIFNKFGSGLNHSLVLKANPSNLLIDNLIKFENKDVEGINADEDGTSFMAIVDNNGSKTLESISSTDDNKVLSSTNINNNIKIDKHAVGIDSYLYNKTDNDLEVISAETGLTAYSIKDIGADTIYMPVTK
ncbi:hypothetical protein C4D27_17950 [Clostridium perfringens]